MHMHASVHARGDHAPRQDKTARHQHPASYRLRNHHGHVGLPVGYGVVPCLLLFRFIYHASARVERGGCILHILPSRRVQRHRASCRQRKVRVTAQNRDPRTYTRAYYSNPAQYCGATISDPGPPGGHPSLATMTRKLARASAGRPIRALIGVIHLSRGTRGCVTSSKV